MAGFSDHDASKLFLVSTSRLTIFYKILFKIFRFKVLLNTSPKIERSSERKEYRYPYLPDLELAVAERFALIGVEDSFYEIDERCFCLYSYSSLLIYVGHCRKDACDMLQVPVLMFMNNLAYDFKRP